MDSVCPAAVCLLEVCLLLFVTDYTMHLLDNVKKIHFIGCGGSGMYPLIQILTAKGYDISGSDVLDGSIIRSEREMGVKVSLGHAADNVIGADLVVYSAAIAKDNVELNAAASYGIPTVERSVLLGYVSRLYKQSICVSGTHGKTTTTSMATHIFMAAQKDPTVMIGGTLPLLGKGYRVGKGDTIILESCEYCNSFLNFFPTVAVILNVAADHLDFFKNLNDIEHSFRQFACLTPENGFIIANGDDPGAREALSGLDRKVYWFSVKDRKADVYADNVAFFDGRKYVTPDTFLLNGTRRQYLLGTGVLTECRITPSDLGGFERVVLINAMLGIEDDLAVPIERIRGL